MTEIEKKVWHKVAVKATTNSRSENKTQQENTTLSCWDVETRGTIDHIEKGFSAKPNFIEKTNRDLATNATIYVTDA